MAVPPRRSGLRLLLGAGMIGLALDLPEPARVGRAAAIVGALAGLVWAFGPWLFLRADRVRRSGRVGVCAWRARRWSGLELVILLVGIVLPWTVVLVVGSGLWAPPEFGPEVQFVILGSLVSVWLVVGGSLVLPRRRGATARDQSFG